MRMVQNALLPYLTNSITESLGSKFTVENISVSFFNKINMTGALLRDQQGDTLIFADNINILTNRIDVDNRKMYFKEITLDNPKLYLSNDSMNINNLQFFIDSLESTKDTSKIGWKIYSQKISFENMHFRFRDYNFEELPKGSFNFEDLEFKNMFVSAKDFAKHFDTLNFNLVDFSFEDKSGFKINHLIAQTTISSHEITFDNPYLETPYSIILGQKLAMYFDYFVEFKNKGIISKVDIEANLNPSNLNFHDITYFSQGLENYDQDIQISGKIKGKINELKGNDLLIKYGKSSKIQGDIYFNGLPDVPNTYVFAQIKQLQTFKKDIESLKIPGKNNKNISLPEKLEVFGNVNYKGNFTGYFDDFVAYGELFCDLGTIKSDLILSPDSVKNLKYKGRLQCIDFDIGSFLNIEKLNKTTFDIEVDGLTTEKGKVSALMHGEVNRIIFNDYSYSNIDVSGELTEKKFNGNVKIDDPNIFFEFDGLFDFKGKTPIFDFTADVQKANLYRLHFDDQDSTYFASFLANANFTGIDPDSITGQLNLLNSFFSRGNRQIQLYDFSLKAFKKNNERYIKLNSDFVDGELSGKYSFSSFVPGFKSYVNQYLPSFPFKEDENERDTTNNFRFNFEFKNTQALTSFFYPDINFANNTSLQGSFVDSLNKLQAVFISPKVEYKEKVIENLFFNILSADSLFSFNLGSKTFLIGEGVYFDNFSIYSDVLRDRFDLKLRWNNWDSVVYKGNMAFKGKLADVSTTERLKLQFDILPSQVIMQDSVWDITQSSLIIDSSSVQINNYNIRQKDQQFVIDGKLSQNPNDNLNIEFKNFNLKYLNLLTEKKDLIFEGIIDGKASLSDIYRSPIFHSDLKIDNLILNNQLLGKTKIISEWDNKNKYISINTVSKLNNSTTLLTSGLYEPLSNRINFDINLNKVNIGVLEPFLNGSVSDLSGETTGKLILSGTANKPLLNGELHLKETSFMINYLQTTYHFSDKVEIINNNLLVNQLIMYDMYNNQAKVNGIITTDYLRDFKYNFNINADHFQMLNTTSFQHNDYYGIAYATGLVSISGPANDILMNINAKTEKNTEIYVPLVSTSEVSEYDFINFVSDNENKKNQNSFKFEENSIAGLRLNFTLDITPDADVQMIFDSKIGDIIKARGEGILKMDIDNFGMFNIYGQYKITSGNYLFTLQNIINKQFVIKPGGTVTWSGDPIEADIDINAVYKLKTNLKSLLQNYGDLGDSYNRSIPVECQLKLTDKLTNPNIELGIELPTASEEDKTMVKNVINTEEEQSRQIFSLLVLGQFLKDQGTQNSGGFGESGAKNTTTELLTSQLNHWLSQISKDWDIGLNYYENNYESNVTGQEFTGRELEVALSTQILNDRVSINGNIDVSTNSDDPIDNPQTANNIVGDFDLDVKITENGKFRFKAFNKAYDYYSLENSYYTQGIGIFYREEFSKVTELVKRYWDAIKRDDEEVVEE